MKINKVVVMYLDTGEIDRPPAPPNDSEKKIKNENETHKKRNDRKKGVGKEGECMDVGGTQVFGLGSRRTRH